MKLYNNMDGLCGMDKNGLVDMGLKAVNVYAPQDLRNIEGLEDVVLEIAGMDEVVEGSVESMVMDWLRVKRACPSWEEGRWLVIPSGANMSVRVRFLKMAILIHMGVIDEAKMLWKGIRVDIAKGIFSKEFNHSKYSRRVSGFAGVALPSNGGIDEIFVPEWTGLRVGELCMVVRHPVQNLFFVCKVAGFTKNEFRVNVDTWAWLDGDFDGDEMNVVPLYQFGKSVVNAGDKLLPSRLMEDEKFACLTAQYKSE